MTKARERLLAFAFGVVFLVALLAIAIAIPEPTQTQFLVFRVVLAIAAAAAAAMVPGFIEAHVGSAIKAGGAIAVFAIVFFFNPANLVAEPPPADSVALNRVEAGTVDGETTIAFEFEIVAPASGSRAFVQLDSDANFSNPVVHQLAQLDKSQFTVGNALPLGSTLFARLLVRNGHREIRSNTREVTIQ